MMRYCTVAQKGRKGGDHVGYGDDADNVDPQADVLIGEHAQIAYQDGDLRKGGRRDVDI